MKEIIFFLSLIFSSTVLAAELTVVNLKGQSLKIDLLQLKGGKVTFTKLGESKKFSLPLKSFSEISQKEIKRVAGSLPSIMPSLEIDAVIISRKRRDVKRSYYMRTQEVSGTVKVKNVSRDAEFDGCSVTTVIFGQDQRDTEMFIVLSTQNFPTKPAPGKVTAHKLESAFTQYDSDNKGYGNIGGFAYCGNIVVIRDKNKRIIDYKVQGAALKKALKLNPEILDKIDSYRAKQQLSKKF